VSMPATYFPHAIFTGEGEPIPRVMVAPQRYIQGKGVVDHTGRYMSLLNAKKTGVLVSKRGLGADGGRIIRSLEEVGIEAVTSIFNGECSLDEIDSHADSLKSHQLDCLIAVGGGKCVDAGKSIAFRLDIPVVIVPTLASNDAPCSSVSVLYTPDGVSAGAEFFPNNPALVIVDTEIVANASERYLVAGMGDAMATWYEARVCLNNPAARSTIGARPTLASYAIGEVCANTLFEEGVAAAKAVADSQVNESLERVVEANTLLSGLGFESGGLAVAHAVAQSFTTIPVVHANFLHGEMVAMGTLTQLMMEDEDEAKRVAEFFASVGLPVHLGQLSLSLENSVEGMSEIESVVAATMAYPTIYNMQMDMNADLVRSSILAAHDLGLSVVSSAGDDAYRKLHGQ